MSNMHVAKQSMSTSFGHACCIIEYMHVADPKHVDIIPPLLKTCMLQTKHTCQHETKGASVVYQYSFRNPRRLCTQSIHVNMRRRERVWFIATPSATLALKCIVNNGYQHAVSHTVTSFIQLSRNSLPSLSRRISSPSAYPRACCPTSYTTYVIYTEGYPCRLPHASPPRRTDFVGQPCLCMSHGFTGHLNSAAGPSIWSMSTT